MYRQKTLMKPIRFDGIGLHSGKPATVWMVPAVPNQGIHFVRTDLEPAVTIKACPENIVHTQMATTIGVNDYRGELATISTVEHLLAAVFGAGIDNLTIEVDGPEIPVLDGSAAVFLAAIMSAGVKEQHSRRKIFRVKKKVEVQLGQKWAFALPCLGFEVHSSNSWDHPLIGNQEFIYRDGVTPFEDIARARTFGFLSDLEKLQSKGLALGASLDNVVGLDGERVLNSEGLRYSDEFVRHKVLDAIGDLRLAGFPIQGYFRMHFGGHEVHRELLKAILLSSENFDIVEAPSQIDSSISRTSLVSDNLLTRAGGGARMVNVAVGLRR